MSAPQAGTYVLISSAFYRTEGEGDQAVRRRYKRGDRVQLSKVEAARLAVPTRLAPAAFLKAADIDVEVAPGSDLVTSPPLQVNRTSEANQLIAEANSGVLPPTTGGALSEAQVESNEAAATTPPITGAGAGSIVPGIPEGAEIPGVDGNSGSGDGPPAKAALLEVWRAYAVKIGAVTDADAGDLTKAQLQAKVDDHERQQAGA